MGWDNDYIREGESPKRFMERRYGLPVLLAERKAGGGVIYAAATYEGRTVALVALLEGGYVKLLDEDMGPAVCGCPAAILDLLAEPTSDYSRDWREACRASVAA